MAKRKSFTVVELASGEEVTLPMRFETFMHEHTLYRSSPLFTVKPMGCARQGFNVNYIARVYEKEEA